MVWCVQHGKFPRTLIAPPWAIKCRWHRPQNALWSAGMGVHMTDPFLSLFGPIEAVAVQSAWWVLDFPTGDVIAVLFRFASGATGQLTAVTKTPITAACRHVARACGWRRAIPSILSMASRRIFFRALPAASRKPGCWKADDSVKANLHEWADAVEGRSQYRFSIASRDRASSWPAMSVKPSASSSSRQADHPASVVIPQQWNSSFRRRSKSSRRGPSTGSPAGFAICRAPKCAQDTGSYDRANDQSHQVMEPYGKCGITIKVENDN